MPEGEWDAFMAVLRTQLPTTFRINGMGKFAQDLRDKLETDFLRTFKEGAVKVWLCTAGNRALQPFQARSFGSGKASAHSAACLANAVPSSMPGHLGSWDCLRTAAVRSSNPSPCCLLCVCMLHPCVRVSADRLPAAPGIGDAWQWHTAPEQW